MRRRNKVGCKIDGKSKQTEPFRSKRKSKPFVKMRIYEGKKDRKEHLRKIKRKRER